MDDIDAKLVGLLTANARLPVATLAKRMKLARSTVQARLDRLESTGAIAGYTLRLGETPAMRRLHATALLQIEPRTLPAVLQRLKAMPQISQAHTASGRTDLILHIITETTEDLDRTLDAIGTIPGVQDCESLIHLTTKIDRGV